MVKVLLCHNPNAGNKGHDRESVEAALKLAGYDVRYASVKDDNFVDALDNSADFIVAAGGDGTLAKVITSLPDRKVPVAVLPLGTANNFARSLGIAGTPQELVEMWDLAHACPVTLGRAKGPWGTDLFLEGYGIGVFPELLLQADKEGKPEGPDNLRHGRDKFRKVLKHAKPFEVVMSIDGKTYAREVLGIEVCNIAFTGPGLPIASKADVSDDKLDLVIFEEGNRKALRDWIEAPQEDKPPVANRKVDSVSITYRNAPARLDDRPFKPKDKELTIEIACDKKPVSILIPVKHPAQKAPEKKASAA